MIGRLAIQRIFKRVFSRGTLLGALFALGITSLPAPAWAQTLLQTQARYPRVRMLPTGELLATMLLTTDGSVKVFSSTNNGTSWTAVGAITDPTFTTNGTSSPDFIVLPNGNLILGLNVDTRCVGCYSKIKIYRSTNNGRNWTYLSTAATSSVPVTAEDNPGFWEPNFSIASPGQNNALVLMYADETSVCCSQKLMRIRSLDNGATWVDRSSAVQLGTSGPGGTPDPRRPGMPVVSKLTDGTGRWLMTYEICGVAAPNNCRSHYRTSTDGWNYGTISDPGTQMTGHLSRYFNGTPMNKTVPNGTLLWMGHFLLLADGTFSGANGHLIFKSVSGNPNGPWTSMNAPVSVDNPTTPGCDGYSPSLQWVNNGSGGYNLVQLQSRLRTSGSGCDVYVGVAPL